MDAREILNEFLNLPDSSAASFLTIERLMIINRYFRNNFNDELYQKYSAKHRRSITIAHAKMDRVKEELYKVAGLNMDIGYRAIAKVDSVKDDFKLAYLEPHQDYGAFYTSVGMTRPFGDEALLNNYKNTDYDTAFIAWTDPELLKIVALMLLCGMSVAEVCVKVNRKSTSVREIYSQLMLLQWIKPTPKFKDTFNYIGHFLVKLINIRNFVAANGVVWNYTNATYPVKQPDLYFPYVGYRWSGRTGTLFEGVSTPSYAFYKCINPTTGKPYTDRADELPLYFCPQSSVMHYDMEPFEKLMEQVMSPGIRISNPFIVAILDSLMHDPINVIKANHDEYLFQTHGSTVTYILALMGRFPEKIRPLDTRVEVGLSGPIGRYAWLTDPRLKYLLVYLHFQNEVILGRPTFQGTTSKPSTDDKTEVDIVAKRDLGAAYLAHTPKYDPYKYHADRSDEETLLELGNTMPRNLGGKTVVKLFNGVWEDEIIKHTIWDVCTKHSLIEFNHKMYRARVDATNNIMNNSYLRPGLTHRPNYFDMPLRLKDLLPKINISRKRVHNIFNYVLKYHVDKNKLSPFKTNYCQLEIKETRVVLTAGLNRLNITHPQWIAMHEYLRVLAYHNNGCLPPGV